MAKPAPESSVAIATGDAGRLDRRTAREVGVSIRFPRLDRPAQHGQQHVAPLLQAGGGILADARLTGDARKGQLAGLALLAWRYLSGNRLSRPFLDPAPPPGSRAGEHIFHIRRHDHSPSPFAGERAGAPVEVLIGPA